MKRLSGPSPRAEIGVSFDSSAGTVAALESLLDLGGRTSDGESQPTVSRVQPPLGVFDLSTAELGQALAEMRAGVGTLWLDKRKNIPFVPDMVPWECLHRHRFRNRRSQPQLPTPA